MLCGGACCTFIAFDPWKGLNEDERHWLELHNVNPSFKVKVNAPCLKLQHGKCSIYSDRPKVCRDFEAGSPKCLEAVRMKCPERMDEIVRLNNKFQTQNGISRIWTSIKQSARMGKE